MTRILSLYSCSICGMFLGFRCRNHLVTACCADQLPVCGQLCLAEGHFLYLACYAFRSSLQTQVNFEELTFYSLRSIYSRHRSETIIQVNRIFESVSK